MSSPRRLSSFADISGAAQMPPYDPARHGHGIVHLGIGAFHRAHQACYTDAALAAAGGDWRIIGASLRSVELADALNPQNGLYTLIERGASGVRAMTRWTMLSAMSWSPQVMKIFWPCSM